MQRRTFQSLLNEYKENDGWEPKLLEIRKKLKEKEVGNVSDEISGRFQCTNLTKCTQTSKRDHSGKQRELLTPLQRSRARSINHDNPELNVAKHGVWRQEQKSRAAKLEKQLKAQRELEALIAEQLNRFHAHYNQAMVLNHLEDVSKLLVPQWATPQELATLSWLGDWRPSAILELLHGLDPSFLSVSPDMEQVLSQLINEIRIEEAIIDEEMTEIQATCIFYLPFAPSKSCKSGGSALHGIQSEFKKIARVITKAQKLRFKALEMLVKKVLNQTDAAEFLVAFSGIQDAIHQFTERKRLQKGPVTVSFKSRDVVVETLNQPNIHLENRISLWDKTSVSSEQERSSKGIQYAIHEFEEQQGLRKMPVTLSVNSQDVTETSKQPKIHLKDRTSLWEKFSLIVEQERSGQGIQDGIRDEQQRLPKGPMNLSINSKDVNESVYQSCQLAIWAG